METDAKKPAKQKSRLHMTHAQNDARYIAQGMTLFLSPNPDSAKDLARMNKGKNGRPFIYDEETMMVIAGIVYQLGLRVDSQLASGHGLGRFPGPFAHDLATADHIPWAGRPLWVPVLVPMKNERAPPCCSLCSRLTAHARERIQKSCTCRMVPSRPNRGNRPCASSVQDFTVSAAPPFVPVPGSCLLRSVLPRTAKYKVRISGLTADSHD